MGKMLNIEIGTKFGRLTIQGELPRHRQPNGKTNRVFKCLCDCGKEVDVLLRGLKGGGTKSCGCYQKEVVKEVNKTHGMARTRPYGIWTGMLQRCLNERSEVFSYYGAKGVCVAQSWMDFDNFWKDMKDGYSDDLSLDRINPYGDYCKENCRWATITDQVYNKRLRSNSTTGITGVSRYNSQKNPYQAYIGFENTIKILGRFATIEEAIAARQKAEIELYGYNIFKEEV